MTAGGQVQFVVPARNAGSTLAECLDSILAQPGVSPGDVIVVDNASDDDTPLIAEMRGVVLLDCEAPGAGAARNAGLRALRGAPVRYLAFIDADVVLPASWAEDGVAALGELGMRVAGVGGPGRSGSERRVARLLDAVLWGWDRLGGHAHRVSSLATMDALFRYDVIADQEFEEELLAGEDPEWCFQLADRGWEVWMVPQMQVVHRHVESVASLLRKWFWYGRYFLPPYFLHPRQLSADVPVRVAAVPLVLCGAFLAWRRPRRRRIAVPAILGATALVPYALALWRLRRLPGERSASLQPVLALIAVGRFVSHSVGIWAGLILMPGLACRCVMRGVHSLATHERDSTQGVQDNGA